MPPDSPSVQPVILAGGSGTRLWPLSRQHFPKQLQPLVSDESLLQQTMRRARLVAPDAQPLVVTGDDTRFLVAEQAREAAIACNIVLEPAGRNTAAAIALAALHFDPATVLIVLASDHAVSSDQGFAASVLAGARLADEGYVVTFGVQPDFPATGYGYIRCGEALGDAFRVDRFTEKPDEPTARAFIEAGGYLWNSGLFMFRVDTLLAEMERYCPEVLNPVRDAYDSRSTDLDFERIAADAYGKVPSISIDYAMMERTARAVTVPLASGWSDVGSFDALWQTLPRDANDNAIRGDVMTVDTRGSLLIGSNRLVTALGVEGLVIVDSDDALLVADRRRSEDLKILIEDLSRSERPELQSHRRVCRPWGYYEMLDGGPRFQVKRIAVLPHSSLSLQAHNHRTEHWVVVSGEATVTCGDTVSRLGPDQSTYVPLGTGHRLANDRDELLEVIEVQSGDTLDETDIVRFADDHGQI